MANPQLYPRDRESRSEYRTKTAGVNSDFFIAADESYMIVSAKETKTFECELYISFRKSDLTWTLPVSLGAKIKDGLAHR